MPVAVDELSDACFIFAIVAKERLPDASICSSSDFRFPICPSKGLFQSAPRGLQRRTDELTGTSLLPLRHDCEIA